MPETASWYLNNGNQDIRLDGSKAQRFDPQLNSNDFTVAAVVKPNTISPPSAAVVFAKLTTTAGDHRSWWLSQQTDDLSAAISQNGDNDTTGSAVVTNCLTAGQKSFISMRYAYSGTPGTSSWLEARCDVATTENTCCYGPIHSSENADVQIGDYDASGARMFYGDIYWIAYWNRKLTDDELDALESREVLPPELAPDYYIDFHQPVGTAYRSEIGLENGIDDFFVGGTILHNGLFDTSLKNPELHRYASSVA